MRASSIDLHLHSTASDGTQTPAELVREAAARGVKLLALTDHDTTEGAAEAAETARQAGVTFVPGVELSVESETRDIHILGFYLREEAEGLQAALVGLRQARDLRNAAIIARLRTLGAPIDPQRVQEIGGRGSVGRPHIAAAMVEAGHVSSQGEAFYRYLARGRPAFVPRARLDPEEACRIVKRAGGIPVLAHAAKIGSSGLIEELVSQGAEGIEVFHTDHAEEDTELLLALARARPLRSAQGSGGQALLITGGSDSHGPRSDRPIAPGSVSIPSWVGEQFLARAPEWWQQRRAGS